MFDNYICFENKWEIDISSLLLMWCSSKNWIDTVWKFWTGLKYAIAVLLRLKIDFRMFIWKNEVKIELKEISINWIKFNQILINWKETWFTTELWKHWQLWQWVREFYANCLDEKGAKLNWRWWQQGKHWNTRVFIKEKQIKSEMYKFCFEKWNKIDENLSYIKKWEISPLKVYKQWFLVFEWDNLTKSLYDYQINNISINESRLVEDSLDMKRGIWQIQAMMNLYNIKNIIENKEYKLWYYSEYDEVNEDWFWLLDILKEEEKNKLPTSLLDIYKKQKSKSDKNYSYWYSNFSGNRLTAYILEDLWNIHILWKDYNLSISWLEDKTQKFNIIDKTIHINTIFKKDLELYKKIAIDFIENEQKNKNLYIVELLEKIYKNN